MRLRADIHAQRNDAAKTANVALACRGGEGEGERQGSGETLVLGGEGYGGGAMTAAAPRGSASYPKAQRPAQRWANRSRKQDEQESRRAGGS